MSSTTLRASSTAAVCTAAALKRQVDGIDLKLLDELSFLCRLTQARSPKRHAYCVPGRRWLAARLGVSVWTVSRHTSKLRELGAVCKVQRRPVHGRWQTNLYTLRGAAAWLVSEPLRRLRGIANRVRSDARIAPSEGRADRNPDGRSALRAIIRSLTPAPRGG